MLRRPAATQLAFFAGCLLTALNVSLPAQGSSPALSLILPRGCQRGAEHVLAFRGARLADAEEIFFYSPGFEVVKLEPAANGSEVKVHVKVAADCRLGEHVAQVRTKSGVSEYRTFFVGALPAVDEKEPNSTFDQPQEIPLNVTVQGVVTSEDVDYFAVDVKKGQRLSVEVEGMRLGSTLFDPYVAILDSKRFELSATDDTPLVRQDCATSIVAPEDGKYFVEVRESSYGGNGSSYYRAHIGSFPRPLAVYPAGGPIGQSTEVRFLGDAAGELKQAIAAPAEVQEEYGIHAEDDGGISPSPNPFRLSEHGNNMEAEPNNAFPEATAAELPKAFNGIIGEAGDIDCFKFAAKKGQVYEVECYARRIRSPLDPVLNLYQADGKSLAGNDDSRGLDGYVRFTVPADGEYILRVTDHLSRGGPNFVYRVEFQSVTPKLTLGIPRVARYSQSRQQIYVARGNRFGTLISASRANFGGELLLEGAGLPSGITMHCEPMAANMNVMPVVFEAAADAPIGGKLVDFTARHKDNEAIRGGFRNRADYVISAPGQSLYVWKDVDLLPIVVVDELPFELELVEPKVPLVRNGSMQLKVVAHRKGDFKAPIQVQLPFRPPGVGGASSVTIPEGKSEALYPISANSNAQVKDWQVYVIGSSNVNGAAWVASKLTKLTVATQYVTFTVQRAACEQGQEAQVYCKLNHATPFDGEATVTLLGLPPKTSAEPLKFKKDTGELTFKVKTDPASPAGKHKNIICRVEIVQHGEPITGTAGVTELQIDKPLPPPKNAPPAPKVAAAPKPKPQPAQPQAKPLSRLEKLRLAAEAARKASAGSEE